MRCSFSVQVPGTEPWAPCSLAQCVCLLMPAVGPAHCPGPPCSSFNLPQLSKVRLLGSNPEGPSDQKRCLKIRAGCSFSLSPGGPLASGRPCQRQHPESFVHVCLGSCSGLPAGTSRATLGVLREPEFPGLQCLNLEEHIWPREKVWLARQDRRAVSGPRRTQRSSPHLHTPEDQQDSQQQDLEIPASPAFTRLLSGRPRIQAACLLLLLLIQDLGSNPGWEILIPNTENM